MRGLEVIDVSVVVLEVRITIEVQACPESGNILSKPMASERYVVVKFNLWFIFLFYHKLCTPISQRARTKAMLTRRAISTRFEYLSRGVASSTHGVSNPSHADVYERPMLNTERSRRSLDQIDQRQKSVGAAKRQGIRRMKEQIQSFGRV